MNKITCLLLMSLSLMPSPGSAENTGEPVATLAHGERAQALQSLENPVEQPPSIGSLLAQMNKNSEHVSQLLGVIASEGCNLQLQKDTIQLVANMTRNIQIMTDVIIRMGYNIEEMSRAPKAMNSFPFMP
jgi:hypothetical protein